MVTVEIKYFSESVDFLKYTFYSFFSDDTALSTLNAEKYGILAELPQFIFEDIYAVDLESQWQAHQDKLKFLTTSDRQPEKLELSEFLTRVTSHSRQYIEQLVHKRIITRQKNDTFKLSLLANIKITHKLLQGNKQVFQMLAKRREVAKKDPSLLTPILPEIEVEAFNRMGEMNSNLVKKKFRTWLLFASLIIFALIYALSQWFDGLNLVVFVGTIAFHELGHALAMKLFRYQDTSVLFIPFFGALATGKKENATLTQKFWVSLAGPLPGLILGFILAFASWGNFSSPLFDASFMFISRDQ